MKLSKLFSFSKKSNKDAKAKSGLVVIPVVPVGTILPDVGMSDSENRKILSLYLTIANIESELIHRKLIKEPMIDPANISEDYIKRILHILELSERSETLRCQNQTENTSKQGKINFFKSSKSKEIEIMDNKNSQVINIRVKS